MVGLVSPWSDRLARVGGINGVRLLGRTSKERAPATTGPPRAHINTAGPCERTPQGAQKPAWIARTARLQRGACHRQQQRQLSRRIKR